MTRSGWTLRGGGGPCSDNPLLDPIGVWHKSQDILTDILLFEEHHRVAELYRDMNIDPTRSLSRDEKGAQMRKGKKFGDEISP